MTIVNNICCCNWLQNSLVRDEPRTITFQAELSQMKDKSCDVMSDTLRVTPPVTSTEEYDGLKFIDDINLTVDDDTKKE